MTPALLALINESSKGQSIMARPLRLEFSGALYHLTSRGDRQEDIFEQRGQVFDL